MPVVGLMPTFEKKINFVYNHFRQLHEMCVPPVPEKTYEAVSVTTSVWVLAGLMARVKLIRINNDESRIPKSGFISELQQIRSFVI